jgi:hypothetical protein
VVTGRYRWGEVAVVGRGTIIGSMVADGPRRADRRRDGRTLGRWLARRLQRGDRDRALEEARGRLGGSGDGGTGARRGRAGSPALGTDSRAVGGERHGHRPVAIGPKDAGARGGQSLERGAGRMPVGIARAGGRDRDPGSDGIHEGLGRGGPASVMGHLEQVHGREAGGQERGVDLLLDVAGQQEPA